MVSLDSVLVVRMALDRRVALIGYVLLSAVVLATTAMTDVVVDQIPDRDDPYAYARVLVAARGASSARVELEIEIVRMVADQTQRSVVRRARTPRGSVEWNDESATLRTAGREWNCFAVEDDWECVETTDPNPAPSFGTPTLFVAAAASGEYRFVDLGARRVGEHDARCYRLVLVGSQPVADIGSRYEACFSAAGPLVSSYHERSGIVEVQRVRSVTQIDDADLARRFVDASRGLVTLDGAQIP
jgi:hypothetical protein